MAPASAASQPKAARAQKTVASPWKVLIANVAVRSGRIHWLDETLASPAQVRLADFTFNASEIALPFAASAPLKFNASVGLDSSSLIDRAKSAPSAQKSSVKRASKASASKPPSVLPPNTSARLALSGIATDQAAQVSVSVADWPLAMADKYIGQFLLPALKGQLDAQLAVSWKAATSVEAAQADRSSAQALAISAPQVSLRDVQLAQGKVSLVSVKQVALGGVEIDIAAQTLSARSLQLSQPKVVVERSADKRWMYERWLVGGAANVAPQGVSAAPASNKAANGAGQAPPSWAVAISELALDAGSLAFSDKAGAKPVAFEVSGLQAKLAGLVLDDRAVSKALVAKPMPLTASLRLTQGSFEPGKVDFRGALSLAPLQAKGRLTIDRLPVQAFEPYFADAVNIDLLRADASFKGQLSFTQTPGGPAAEVAGDVALENFKANSLVPSEDLLAWKASILRGLKVALAPAKPTQVDVRETVLTDFFARVIVTPEGRINLQDLLKPAASGAAGKATLASGPGGAGAPGGAGGAGGAGNAASSSGSVDAIKIIAANNGGTLASGLNDPKSAVSAVGVAAAAPPVINFGPVSLVNGSVRFSDRFVKPNYSADLTELTGKLSVDLNYVVLPNGQLTARNKLVLNQLSFGDKVAGSTASLPVKLAVALLADRNGVIDLDLPISGSLNDPQFSLGPVVVKVILNVIVKAITAPFSLLASALGGGGEELSTVAFSAGSAALTPVAQAGLDKVAKALTDRPSLRLTVVGSSSREVEQDGFKQERLIALLRAEKRRALVKEGDSDTATLSISPAERPALLKEVYKRVDMPKPCNAIGVNGEVPAEDMEKLLLANIGITDDALRELAVQRGVAVRNYLASHNLPLERLFLGAAKTVPHEAKWTPRAELQLASP